MSKKTNDNMVKDTRDKTTRRNDRLKLRDKALELATSEGKPFDDTVPAIEFEKDFDAAMKKAIESPKAITAEERTKNIEAIKAKMEPAETLTAEETPAVEPTTAEETTKTPAPTSAELVQMAKKAIGRVVDEETRNGEPPVDDIKVDDNLVEAGTFAATNENEPTPPPAVEDPMLRREGESKNAWKKRKAELLNATASQAPNDTAVKSAIESANVFEAAAMNAETEKQDEPATEAPVAEPSEETSTDETERVEPASTTEASVEGPESVESTVVPEPVEQPRKKLTLVSTTERTPEQVAAAKKFYAKTWTDEFAPGLTNAHVWLLKAQQADLEVRGLAPRSGNGPEPVIRYRLAMNTAMKFEAETLGYEHVPLTLKDVNEFYKNHIEASSQAKAA